MSKEEEKEKEEEKAKKGTSTNETKKFQTKSGILVTIDKELCDIARNKRYYSGTFTFKGIEVRANWDKIEGTLEFKRTEIMPESEEFCNRIFSGYPDEKLELCEILNY